MQFDRHGSPFIPFPSPHTTLRLTSARYTDGDAVIAILSDPSVYMNLNGPPFPYRRQEWDEWFPVLAKSSDEALVEWREVKNVRESGKLEKWVGVGAPVTAIREVDRETGEERFLGEIMIRRRDFLTVTDENERKKAKDENDGLEAGDPRIEWEIGFYLAPSVHGRGIMTAAIRTLLDAFFIPYMNVHHIAGAFFEHNSASRRVFEKNGFTFEKMVPDVIELPESKTGVKGKKVGFGITKWERK